VGTSKNVPSPDTPPWKPLLAILGRTDTPIDRQTREIWRSAGAERGHRLIDEFAGPALAMACSLSSTSEDVRSATQAYDVYLSREHHVGFATEIAKRALCRAVATKEGEQGFASELFAEATSYYASRDLPSFVGARGRVRNVSDAIQLKGRLKELSKRVVENAGTPSSTPDNWARYVASVISNLQGER